MARGTLDLREMQEAILREEMGHARRAPPARGAPVVMRVQPDAGREAKAAFTAPFSGDGPPGGGGPPRGARRPERGIGIDVHELMKREAFAAAQPGCDNHFEVNRPCPEGVHGVSDQYMTLDSFEKLRESRVGRGEFRWNFMVQGVTGDQVIGVRDRVDTVTEMQMGSFSLPILPEVPYVLAGVPVGTPTGTDQLVLVQNNLNVSAPFSPFLRPNSSATVGQYPKEAIVATVGAAVAIPWINNPYTQLPFFGRLTVQVAEAGLQSYSDRNGARHHFTFQVTAPYGTEAANPTMLQATPLVGGKWDTFVFTDPLKDVHGVTLVFRSPDIPVQFQPDCLYDVSIESDGSAAPGPFLRVRAPGHGLLEGDRIFIEGFKSGNPRLDAYVNRPEGQVAASDPSAPAQNPGSPLDPNVFWFDPAVSIIDLTVQVPVLPQVVTVCIAKRRLLIPVRFRRVVARLTNYIIP